jgi:hypothetical protein
MLISIYPDAVRILLMHHAHTLRVGTLEGDRILWLSLLHRRPSTLAQEKTTALRSETLEDLLRDLVC